MGEFAAEYAFKRLGLDRIWGEVLPDNVASQKFHLRHGFVLDSVLTHKTVDGQTIDNVSRYVLTKECWRELHQGGVE